MIRRELVQHVVVTGLVVAGVGIGVLSAGASLQAAPQTHPDFSGRWTLDEPAPTPGQGRGGRGAPARGDMGSGWGSPLTIAQSGTELKITYAFYGRGDMQPPMAFVFALDGSETRNAIMTGQSTDVERSRTAWDGSTLVITTTQSFVDPGTGKTVPVDVTRRLSLEADGTLVVETTRAGVLGGPASTTRSVYKKS